MMAIKRIWADGKLLRGESGHFKVSTQFASTMEARIRTWIHRRSVPAPLPLLHLRAEQRFDGEARGAIDQILTTMREQNLIGG
jgi:hypothetical protein